MSQALDNYMTRAFAGRSFQLHGLGVATMPQLTGKALARAQFLTWLKGWNRGLFEQAVTNAEDWRTSEAARQGKPATISGLGQTTDASGNTTTAPTSWWQQIASAVTSLGTAYVGYESQKATLDLNLQRAQQGLPPISTATMAPTVTTQVDLSPQILARLQDTTTKALLYGGIAIGAFLILNAFTKKRR
jgi:hypothetical protein